MFEPALRCLARGLWRTARGMDAASLWLHLAGYDNPRGWRRTIAANASLRNRFAGRRAFVIGNGPSLQRQDLAPLAGEITLVANAFWRHPVMGDGGIQAGSDAAGDWQPTVYSIIDPLYTDASAPMDAFFTELRQRVTGGIFLVNLRGLDVIRERQLLPLDRVYPCLMRGNPDRVRRFEPRLDRPLPGMQSVAVLNVLAAMHLGCDPIYLLGMDHDWLASPIGACRHFYAGPSVSDHEEVEAIESRGHHSYASTAADTARLFRSHERLRELAESRGGRIYNASEGGFLDVYPRVNYRDVVPSTASRPPEADADRHTRLTRSAPPDRHGRPESAAASSP